MSVIKSTLNRTYERLFEWQLIRFIAILLQLFEFPTQPRYPSVLQNVQTPSWGQPSSYIVGTGARSSEIRRPEREADHLPSSSAEAKTEWNNTSYSP